MPKKNLEVDAYIAAAAPFARPILRHLRSLVHRGCPEVEEKIKWGAPHFDYKGPIAGMAAFKSHCAFGFWKGELIFGEKPVAEEAMGHFGRIECEADLPNDKVLLGYLRKAIELNEAGIKRPQPPRVTGSRKLEIPPDLAQALQRNARARKSFENFSYSKRKDYVEWITEAKRAETRRQRLTTTLEWLAAGKSRNWKYERKS
jgi:uncharacterized protein YdeI (YjbR/CyaY-like superfamily)